MVTQLTYRQQSRRFLEQARRELREGDLAQASEKGWGAASQMVKAVAQSRGWQHDQHRLLLRAVTRLSEDHDDTEISDLLYVAQALHTNFYEGEMNEGAVTRALSQVARLVDKLEALLPEE